MCIPTTIKFIRKEFDFETFIDYVLFIKRLGTAIAKYIVS